jgi:uncharacterized protein with PIN domain
MNSENETRERALELIQHHGRPARFRKLSAKHGERQQQRCQVCGRAMRITRRQEHPARGPQYELQTFTCPHCANIQYTSAASLGACKVD